MFGGGHTHGNPHVKRTHTIRDPLRLLPLLLWVGWLAAVGAPEPPASGPATGERQPVVAPLLEVALPSVPSLRVAAFEGAERIPVGSGGSGDAAVAERTAPLRVPGASLDPNLRGALHPYLSLLERVSYRTRGPPFQVV
jgi:hypothetical protein